MTLLSAAARYFRHVFTRVNIVYTEGPKEMGPGDRSVRAMEMNSDARAHMSEKPTRVVGGNNPPDRRIRAASPRFPTPCDNYLRGGERQCKPLIVGPDSRTM
jgi:hypothetical protein